MDKRIFLTLAFGLIIFLFPGKVYAQTSLPASGYDVSVSPVYFDLSANPGTAVTSKIRIRNNTSSPIPIKLGVERLTGDLNGNYNLKQDINDTTLSWIKFENNSVVTNPLEWTEIPFTIDVPKDAAYGYYWTITFAQDKTGSPAKNGVSLTGAAGIPVLLNVKKDGAKAEAKILNFSAGPLITEYLPVNFTVKVQNSGNVHVKPHGNIFISSGNSKNLTILDINPSLGSILPNSARVFDASWNDGFITVEPKITADGQPVLKNGKSETELKINWDKLTEFRIGRYTANLLLVFDNGKRDVPLESTITFWVLPYKALAVIAVVLITSFFLIRWLIKSYISREVAKRLQS
jgi:hypothetical protein